MSRPRYWNGQKHKCYGKTRYDKKGAITQAKYYKKRTGDYMRPYHCPYCNHWHVGHSNSRKASYTKTRHKSNRQKRAEQRIRKQLRRLSA